MELFIFLGTLFFFLAFGIPICLVLVLCAMVLMWQSGMWDAMIIPGSMLDGANNYPLMAIPFFVFAGEIMAAGGLSQRVVQLAQLMIGRVRGGLGYAAVVSSVIFAGLMGSSVGEAAALGGLLLPMMKEVGYKPGRAGAVIASGAILGPIIPPSTNFILLGATISGLSITKLFMIGLFPGIFIGLALMVVWFFVVRKDGYNETITFTREEKWKILIDSTPAFLMPVLLLGGIRFGIFTPTEGGAFAAIYAIIVCMLYYRELSFRELLRVSARAARTTSVVMLIVATATAVGWFITIAQIPNQMTALFSPLIDSPILLLLCINVFLFLIGMVMDLTPNILIFAPVFYPLITQAGIDPYYFGLLFVLNLGIGVITPPVGTVLYVVCGIGNIKITQLIRNLVPFIVVEVVMLFLLLFFPKLSLIPLNWLMGGN
ncbi:TRAP transporter large permease [Desulfovibrio sp. PG-178-WT-4]|uniref:TRAP transporter large permease n=1 Tax=Desulfovibrio porci TaxID=2605782 RepID=A0A6L5XLH4_9BACT|nr:TRAP transporter large permease [Desulfovibrio porci]MDY3810028.1 TRAP transporter large permease [Desulfovibrio porci]MSS27899.1 TRAP transporter large permease [Desulfovibrio porci]